MRIYVLVFLFVSTIYGQESTKTFKEISGVVTFQNSPLQGVNVIVDNSQRGTQTNNKGA